MYQSSVCVAAQLCLPCTPAPLGSYLTCLCVTALLCQDSGDAPGARRAPRPAELVDVKLKLTFRCFMRQQPSGSIFCSHS